MRQRQALNNRKLDLAGDVFTVRVLVLNKKGAPGRPEDKEIASQGIIDEHLLDPKAQQRG